VADVSSGHSLDSTPQLCELKKKLLPMHETWSIFSSHHHIRATASYEKNSHNGQRWNGN
jgi:hypothetical protein